MIKHEANAEERLKRLVDANKEENRFQWAEEWKKQGKKVIGVLSPYVPEEVIHAAGAFPWRVSGSWQEDVSLALVYRPQNTCRFCTHALQSLLAGELDFLDGAVTINWDDDFRRLYDVWSHLSKSTFNYILHTPPEDSSGNRRHLTHNIERFAERLGEFAQTRITSGDLQRSIASYNEMRSLLRRIYDLRKRERPPLSGAEVLGITTAASVMPVEEFVAELTALLPYLEKRQTPLKAIHPRLLVSSDLLDNPAYLQLVENEGALVAMDDLDRGSRYCWYEVSANGNPMAALADSIMERPPCPRMIFWDKGVDNILTWVKEWRIDGVLDFPQIYSYTRLFGRPYFQKRMTEAGIPFISIDRDYNPTAVGQLRTRIGAFIETLTL
ncbi:MAG: 2-hydroxyacyl-CoA dehydratase [Chloroflexi bacterium]|nr:2-hydroxyacyl-CoA dehydratase [Chloroflexota bacterium]